MADVVSLGASADTPEWWLRRLWKKNQDESARFEMLFAYQAGNHRLPDGHIRAREAYRSFQRKARSNYVGLVTHSVVERLKPVGFRTGSATANDQDAEAWRIWQANRFDARCPQLLLAASTASIAYVMVIPNPQDATTPIWTIKDPRCTTVERDPVTNKVIAALTWWTDDVANLIYAWVILPDGIYEFSTKQPRSGMPKIGTFTATTVEDGSQKVLPNPSAPEIPLVPFVNRPDIEGDGMGEFEDVIDIQDRINAVVLDRLVISKMQAYRQRWVSGVETEDENGNPQAPFRPGADLIWAVEDDKAKFGDFAATDITPILKASEEDVKDLAAITRTPPHYLMGQMVNVSGDALKAAESGLVSKVQERQLHYGESFEDVMRLTFALLEKDLPVDAEVIWASPEFRTISEVYDAASKAAAAGVPWRARMELLGKTPQEIQRLEEQRVEDALLMAQYPQLELPGTPVRYSAAAIPADATKTNQPEMTGGNANAGPNQ